MTSDCIDKIAVLIPCFNEEKTIEKVVSDFRNALPDAVIYVYDNNSTDNTAEIAEKAGAVVRHETVQGKGNVIRRMFREIDAECYILTDGDDTYPAENASEMAEYVLRNHCDMVIGDRLSTTYFSENKRPFHNLGNSTVRFFINRLFRSEINDIMTGYRALSYNFVKTFPVLSHGFEIETEMTIHAIDKNMPVKNIGIAYRDRPEGSVSKLNTYSDGFKVIKTIFKLFKFYKPFNFFCILSVILMIIAGIFFVPVMQDYIRTGEVQRFPTLIVCGFTAIASIQTFFSGMILSSISRKNRQDFEILLNQTENDYKQLIRERDRN